MKDEPKQGLTVEQMNERLVRQYESYCARAAECWISKAFPTELDDFTNWVNEVMDGAVLEDAILRRLIRVYHQTEDIKFARIAISL